MPYLNFRNAAPEAGSGPDARITFDRDAGNPNGLFVAMRTPSAHSITRLSTEDTIALRDALLEMHPVKPQGVAFDGVNLGEEPEPEPTYAVGDRVRVKASLAHFFRNGILGTVQAVHGRTLTVQGDEPSLYGSDVQLLMTDEVAPFEPATVLDLDGDTWVQVTEDTFGLLYSPRVETLDVIEQAYGIDPGAPTSGAATVLDLDGDTWVQVTEDGFVMVEDLDDYEDDEVETLDEIARQYGIDSGEGPKAATVRNGLEVGDLITSLGMFGRVAEILPEDSVGGDVKIKWLSGVLKDRTIPHSSRTSRKVRPGDRVEVHYGEILDNSLARSIWDGPATVQTVNRFGTVSVTTEGPGSRRGAFHPAYLKPSGSNSNRFFGG